MSGRHSRVALLSIVAIAATVGGSGGVIGEPFARQVDVAVPIVTVSREQVEQVGLAIDVLKEINEARVDPKAYADGLRRNPIRLRGVGSKDVTEALTFLDGQAPLSPLAGSPQLTDIATIHVRDIGPLGLTSHTGSDGRTLGARWRDRGAFTMHIAEELSFGQTDARAVVFQLIVDPGNPGRQHRNDLFNPVFTQGGAACGKHKQFGSACVINLASPYMRDPPMSSAPPPDPPRWSCPSGEKPWEVDAWRRLTLNALTNDFSIDLDSALPNIARANETVYQANRSPTALGLGIAAGGLWKSPPLDFGFCAPDPPGAPPAPVQPPARLDLAFGPVIPLPDLFQAGVAHRPGLVLEIEPGVDWADWKVFDDFTIDDLTTEWDDIAIPGDFNADDLSCDAPPVPVSAAPISVPDLYAGYSYSNAFGFTSIQAGVNSIFSEPPPRIFNGFLANPDAENYDYLGRYFYVGLRHCL